LTHIYKRWFYGEHSAGIAFDVIKCDGIFPGVRKVHQGYVNDLSEVFEDDGGTTQTTDESDEKTAGSMLLE